MEEEARPRPSVAELAGRFKGSTQPDNEANKPVRRRPPQTLQIPNPSSKDQAPPPTMSPQKVKRNSALIEKLQANLALSPTVAPLKSPGLRVLPLAFTPPYPVPASATQVTTPSSTTPTSPMSTSPLTEEGPASFEAPPSAADVNILQSINKGRARGSIRRPPSRRHRKSSGGDEVSNGAVTKVISQTEGEETGGGGGGGGEEVFNKEVQIDSSPPEKTEEEEMKISCEEEEGGLSSSHLSEEEEKTEDKLEAYPTEETEDEEKMKSSS